MDPFPTLTDLAENPETGRGHLWILEAVEGVPLRFSLQDDGRLVFADEHQRLDPADAPPAISPAIRQVQMEFRRDTFREAVEGPSAVTFYGIATCQHRIAYDWDRLPAFLGYDVRSPARGGLLTPEAAHASYDRLGLAPAPAVEREVRADAFDPDRYAFPASAWADCPVAGVRLADKHGWRGHLSNSDHPDRPTPAFEDAVAAVDALLDVDEAGETVERVVDRLARERRAELRAAGIDPTTGDFRRAVASALTR